MCGIAGNFDYRNGSPVNPEQLRAMTRVLAHRGPDGDGHWISGAVGLGHRRLAIIDTRDVANSRRAGFSKKLLAASLDEGGMTYLHLRPLGTPKAGRDANRAGRMDDFRRIYMARFSEPDAQLALLEAEDLCRTSATALLCFCGDEKKCHRHIIATALESKGLKRKEIAFR
jgi:uncharacterized protein (DUF488 family)